MDDAIHVQIEVVTLGIVGINLGVDGFSLLGAQVKPAGLGQIVVQVNFVLVPCFEFCLEKF